MMASGAAADARSRTPKGENTYPYGYMMSRMARAATTADVFNAIAEPRRRQLLDLVAGRERSVNDLVAELGPGPAVGVEAPAGAPRGRGGART
jgi:hypothetical protein